MIVYLLARLVLASGIVDHDDLIKAAKFNERHWFDRYMVISDKIYRMKQVTSDKPIWRIRINGEE
jgi:hypothetical protein